MRKVVKQNANRLMSGCHQNKGHIKVILCDALLLETANVNSFMPERVALSLNPTLIHFLISSFPN